MTVVYAHKKCNICSVWLSKVEVVIDTSRVMPTVCVCFCCLINKPYNKFVVNILCDYWFVVSVRPMLMSDIWPRRIGGNWTHRRWKGNGTPAADAPNLQRWVYDVAVAATKGPLHTLNQMVNQQMVNHLVSCWRVAGNPNPRLELT